jgi:hypothetical protein
MDWPDGRRLPAEFKSIDLIISLEKVPEWK